MIRRRALSVLLLAVASITGLSGCVGAPADNAPAPVAVTADLAQQWVSSWRPHAEPLDWERCDDDIGAECARMSVPRDWADPTGDRLEIPVRRYPSSQESAPVLLLIQGGPGGSGTALVSSIAGEYPDLTELFTLVGFDPRGVWGPDGADHPLDCPPDAEGCERSTDLSRLASTADVALDIENLRRDVGAASLNAVAYSYGTYVAGIYATLFPDEAGRLVFDGAATSSSFTPVGTERQSIAFEEALDRFIDACLAGELGECPLRGGPDAAKRQLIDLRTQLAHLPVRMTIDGEEALVDAGALTDHLQGALYLPRSTWPSALAWLTRVFEAAGAPPTSRPGAAPATTRAPAMSREDGEDGEDGTVLVPRGISQAVMCAVPEATDPPKREDLEPLHGDEYFFISDSGDAQSDRAGALECAAELPLHLDPDIAYSGAQRFLVTSTSGDPATPFADAATLTDQLHATLLEVTAEGHTSVFGQSSCTTKAAIGYLLRGELPEDGTVCRD